LLLGSVDGRALELERHLAKLKACKDDFDAAANQSSPVVVLAAEADITGIPDGEQAGAWT
jgi:hypothetical protein